MQVIIARNHQNGFASLAGQPSWPVSARAVAVGGIPNAILAGAAPIMFNQQAVIDTDRGTEKTYCDPQGKKCSDPNKAPPANDGQFAWTTFCMKPQTCNVSASDAKNLIAGGGAPFLVYEGMNLGPNNQGQDTSVCQTLLNSYPNGADLPVAIEVPDLSDPTHNALLVEFWIWHLDTANSNCQGKDGEQLSGYFVDNITSTLPLTVTPCSPSTPGAFRRQRTAPTSRGSLSSHPLVAVAAASVAALALDITGGPLDKLRSGLHRGNRTSGAADACET